MHHSFTTLLLALTTHLVSATDNTSPNLGPGKELPGGWSYYGCYSDDISNRALDVQGYTDTTGMSEGSCMVYCGSAGYTFAGIEYDYIWAAKSRRASSGSVNLFCRRSWCCNV